MTLEEIDSRIEIAISKMNRAAEIDKPLLAMTYQMEIEKLWVLKDKLFPDAVKPAE